MLKEIKFQRSQSELSENFTSGGESESESEKSIAERPKSNEFSQEFFPKIEYPCFEVASLIHYQVL